MKERTPRTNEQVLAELAWVRRLARRLCADAASADDLSQEVLLAGIAQPPRAGIPVRRWLAGIARRKAKMAMRGASRRTFHEGAVPGADAAPGTRQLLERLEEHRRVSDAVAGLREPYRTTLLQRYVEDLTPTAIAARNGEPLSSVKTRLARGLALLREDLERTGGHHWYASLLPLARTGAPEAATVSPYLLGATMTAKHGLAVLTILILALVGYLAWPPPGEHSNALPPGVVAAEREPALKAEGLEELAAVKPVGSRADSAIPAEATATEAVPQPAETEPESVAAIASTTTRLRVVVRTPFGEPLPGVVVEQVSLGGALEPSLSRPGAAGLVRELGTTDDGGELSVEVTKARSHLQVADQHMVSLVQGVLSELAPDRSEAVIVAGAVRRIEGVVTDEEGAPIRGATVTLICVEDFSARFSLPVAMKSPHLETVTTDEAGRYAFPRSSEAPRSMVKAEATGFVYRMVDAPDRGDASVPVVLSRTQQGDTALRGRVVCVDGSSSVGAWVAFAETGASTQVLDENGVFELLLGEHETVVHAVLPGMLPARFQRGRGQPWPDELVLELGESTLAIGGVVVDHEGRPCAGVHVGVSDGEAFGAVFEAGGDTGSMRRLEDMGARSGSASCTTAEDGTFQLDGLLARPYRLLVQEAGTLRALHSTPIQAGQEGVRLVLDRSVPLGPLAGRVVDLKGQPLEGIHLRLWRRFGIADPYNAQANRVDTPSTRTDADGRFRMPDSAFEGASLRGFGGVQVEPMGVELQDVENPLELELVMARNSPFCIEWSGGRAPGDADTLVLHDSTGEVAVMLRHFGEGVVHIGEIFVSAPATPVHYVREGSYEVVLMKGHTEVERFPIVIEGAAQQTLVH